MKSAKSVTKYVRVPPRKARLAADLIRGLNVEEATLQLLASQLKAGRLIEKTLRTAVSDAETLMNVQRKDLFVQEVKVDEGPVLKRAKSKNKGGKVPVIKRTSHFTVVVAAR